jgi:hypothetical protein
MTVGFLNEMRAAPDHRVASMATVPLDEILLATLMLATLMLATLMLATLMLATLGLRSAAAMFGSALKIMPAKASIGCGAVCRLCRATRARRRSAQCSA